MTTALADMNDIDFIRKMLALYDEGLYTDGEVVGRILDRYLTPMVEAASNGRECGHFTSVCGGEDIPHLIKRAIIEVGALGKPVWFKPMPKSKWVAIKRFLGFCREECDGKRCGGWTDCDHCGEGE